MAAFEQYNTCMKIMVRIDVSQLAEMKEEFDASEGGLTLKQFLHTMLRRLQWNKENGVELIQNLIELFAQIDINVGQFSYSSPVFL